MPTNLYLSAAPASRLELEVTITVRVAEWPSPSSITEHSRDAPMGLSSVTHQPPTSCATSPCHSCNIIPVPRHPRHLQLVPGGGQVQVRLMRGLILPTQTMHYNFRKLKITIDLYCLIPPKWVISWRLSNQSVFFFQLSGRQKTNTRQLPGTAGMADFAPTKAKRAFQNGFGM